MHHAPRVGQAQRLDGRIWVVDFVYTRCRTYCPVLTTRMKQLRAQLAELRDRVGFLSISVDPEHDTPQVLARYAQRRQLALEDPKLPPWHLLTGRTQLVSDVVVQGFRVPMGKPRPDPSRPSDILILHARHFVLLDKWRRIRGYYRLEPEALERLRNDVRRLLQERDPTEAP